MSCFIPAPRRVLPAMLLLAGLALVATGCGRRTPAATSVPVATTAPAAAATTAPATAATERPSPAPAATTAPLPTPGTAGSPLPTPNISTSPVQPPTAYGAVVTLQRTGGLAGVSQQWSIYPDGRVQLPNGTQSQLSADQVSALLAALDQAGFFALQDSYGQGDKCRDCFNYQLTVNDNGHSRTVSFVEGAADTPPEVTAALKAVNELLAQAAQ